MTPAAPEHEAPRARRGRRFAALGTATLGFAAAEHLLLARRRRRDAEGGEDLGARACETVRLLQTPDGACLHVEETGRPSSRRGAIFVHGSAMRNDVWHYQKGGIDGHRLLFYDQRGHGRSKPKGGADYLVETLAGDVELVREDAGLDQVVLVGHSLGGMVVLALCAQRRAELGERIKGIVLVNTTHKPPIETMAGGAAVAHLERVLRRPFDFVGSHSHRIDVLRRVIRPSDALFWAVSLSAFGPDASPKQVDFAYDMLAETSSDVIFDLLRAYRHFRVTDELLDLAVPALVIAGSHDRLTVPRASEDIAAHLPKAELAVLEGGHLLMLEKHGEVNTMLRRFLEDTLGAPGEKG
jgi:pimeloyl-ACP methyl ester carboxylesterase